MRRLLGSAAIAALMSCSAFAADLPARVAAPVPVPVYVAPIFTWTGFYVGANIGAAFGNDDRRGADYVYSRSGTYDGIAANVNADLEAVGLRGDDDAKLTGGVQIGYNWQFGSLVVGIEADINAMSRGDRNDGYTILNVGGYPYDLTVSGEGRGRNWFGTLRPRIGFAMDRTLLYVTGGLAYSGGSNRGGSAILTDPNNGDVIVADWQSTRRSGSNWGWTLGGGVEHAFSNNWTVKLEYLYVDLDRGGNGEYVSVGNGAPYDDLVGVRGRRNDDNFHVVRVGLNYKFGGGASSAPVLARY